MSAQRTGGVVLAVALLVLGLTPAGASALEEHTRSGFFIGFGLGGGNAAWDWGFESDDDPSEGSGVGQFRIGGAVSDNLILGLETSAWVKDYDVDFGAGEEGTATLTFSAATFGATWFPQNMGWFLRGGVGLATAEAEVTWESSGFDLSGTKTENGFAVLGATGYEWRFTRKFAFGPAVELMFLGIDSDLVKDVIVVDGALEFNWYW
jgi:hypothetical protein